MISATSGGVPPATRAVSLSRKGWPDGTFCWSILSPWEAYFFSNSAASFWLASSHGPGVDQYIHCSMVLGFTWALGATSPAACWPVAQAVSRAVAPAESRMWRRVGLAVFIESLQSRGA